MYMPWRESPTYQLIIPALRQLQWHTDLQSSRFGTLGAFLGFQNTRKLNPKGIKREKWTTEQQQRRSDGPSLWYYNVSTGHTGFCQDSRVEEFSQACSGSQAFQTRAPLLTIAFSQGNNAGGSIGYQWYTWGDLWEPIVMQNGLAEEACEHHGQQSVLPSLRLRESQRMGE